MKSLRSKAISLVTALFLVLTLLPMLPQGILTADAAADEVYVSTWDQLEAALTNTANKGKTVYMQSDIKSESKTKITASVPLTLNMHVNSLEFPGYLSIEMPDESDTFTISGGGWICGRNMDGGAVVLSKGKLNIVECDISNADGEGKYSI